MTQHENIGVQCLEIARRVLERFAFGQAGSVRRDVDHVRAQPNARPAQTRCAFVCSVRRKNLPAFCLRNAGTFLISRVPTSLNASAVSRMKVISSADSSRSPSRSFAASPAFVSHVLSDSQTPSGSLALPIRTRTFSCGRCRQILSDVIGANRQFAMAAIDSARRAESERAVQSELIASMAARTVRPGVEKRHRQ